MTRGIVPNRKIGVWHQFLTDEAISGVKAGGPIIPRHDVVEGLGVLNANAA